ncbi:hypothetical protein ACFYYH_31205 [Streptomyces sp. NPDC002018]|uniref:hypothetical protein n=1 Tax=Streptomyces sp. NPDC002018 TaxID=3364629 RepID=UPI0036960287
MPRLPAPEGRLSRVRERAGRTRRRRRTAAATAAVTGLVLAGTLGPDALGRGLGPALPAAPAASATSGDSAQDSRVRFSEVAGLTLRLPAHWQALQMPEDLARTARARGFASSQRLTPYERPCPEKDLTGCPPVRSLQHGGALLTLVPWTDGALADKVLRPPVLYGPDDPSPSCRKIHGTREYSALLGSGPASRTTVSVTLCVAGDAPAPVMDVRAMITDATFGTEGIPAAPAPVAPAPAPAGSATEHP